MKVRGWLVSMRIHEKSATLVLKTRQGERIACKDSFVSHFYLIAATPNEVSIQEIAAILDNHPLVHSTKIELKHGSSLSKQKTSVIRVNVTSASSLKRVARDVKRVPGVLEVAETHVPNWFKYSNKRGLSFFSEYLVELDASGWITNLSKSDEDSFPNLSLAAIAKSANGFELSTGRANFFVPPERLRDRLLELKVDLFFTAGGDEFLKSLPQASVLGSDEGTIVGDCLHVDLGKDLQTDIYLDAPAGSLNEGLGRLLELGNDRLYRLHELSLITGTSPEIVSRVTPGKLNTYLHYQEALRRDYLIPDSKKLVEQPKTLAELQEIDKGGTIFYPRPGKYANVAKCDFSSMYPSIIVKHNISPDALDCNCCQDNFVPGTRMRLCKRIQGIIPAGIKKVLDRRLQLKAQMRKETNPIEKRRLDLRQKALKNILVTCFGYLGYNAFVFSNVECKELVMLYGRKTIEEARKIVEEGGFEVVYGIVDSLFVSGGGNYCDLVGTVSEKIGINFELEHVFSAIVFPASSDGGGVANKYYGLTECGEIEARGIALRHSDACALVRDFEKEATFELLSKGENQNVSAILSKYGKLIDSQQLPLSSYVIVKPIRKEIGEYTANAPHVVAFRQAPNEEMVSAFVYTVHGAKPVEKTTVVEVDVTKYKKLLACALEELEKIN